MPAVWQKSLEEVVITHGGEGDGSHDLSHCRRVWRNAAQIADALDEPVDRLVLLAASYLHDIISMEKNDPRRGEASRRAAVAARQILLDLAFPADKLNPVAHAIEAHSFSGGIAPETIEAKILQDADRIESLGAIGIARIFYVGGRIGRRLYHEDDPFSEHRELDDFRFTLDHFRKKVVGLPALMNTMPARALAEQRGDFIKLYLSQFASEIGWDAGQRGDAPNKE